MGRRSTRKVIISGVRTPLGDFGGSLQTVEPRDLMMIAKKESNSGKIRVVTVCLQILKGGITECLNE